MFDLLIYNAKIYSFDKDNSRYSAMLIKDGKVEKLTKTNAFDFDLKVSEVKEIVDFHSLAITPSFIYPRAHVALGALFFFSTDIAKLRISKKEPTFTTDDLLFEMKDAPSPGLFKTRVFYNFDPGRLKRGERFTFEEVGAIFGKAKLAIFSKDMKSGFFSPDLFSHLKLPYEDYGGVLSGDDFTENFSQIYAYLYKQQASANLDEYIDSMSQKYLDMGYTFLATIDGSNLEEDDPTILCAKLVAQRSKLNIMNFEYLFEDYLPQINRGFLFGEPSPINQLNAALEENPANAKYIISFLTREVALAIGIEEDKGTIEVGKDADFIAFNFDPVRVGKEMNEELKIVSLMMNGQFVHKNEEFFPKDNEE